MEALLVSQLVFDACDTPALQENLVQNSAHAASVLDLPSIVIAAAASVLGQDVELKSLIWF